ncbi:MAG: D-aspartate ligase [Thermoleophilaceae bacterium]|nr:D-aspartate ligase [Thermoleophilaceae bacterium]
MYALGDITDPVRASRHCHEFTDVGAKKGVADRYLEWLSQAGPRAGAVLPCDDDSLEMIARHRALLVDWGYSPIEADDEVLLAMLDKDRTYELSRLADVPTPRTATVRTYEEAVRAADEFSYPCALKPLSSHEFAQHFGILKKVLLAADRDELLREFERTLAVGVEMLVTEIVPGGDDQYFSYYSYLDERGEPLYHFCKRKLRQWPVHFGLTTYHETIWDPRVAALGLKFFQGVGLRGVGNVEFKRDPRDGEYKIIECNHRFTAASDLVRRSGIDMPLIAYRRALGLPVEPVRGYRLGVRMWHPIEDVRSLRGYREEGSLTVGGWAKSLWHRQHFPLLSLEDPGPSVASLSVKARRFGRKLVPWR